MQSYENSLILHNYFQLIKHFCAKKMANQDTNYSAAYYAFLVTFLGMISAFGPFVTDMYLPTLPNMMEAFSTTMPMVQLGLTTALIGLGAGQLVFGPLSDRYGRRPILVISMALFSVAALVSIFSETIEFFLVCRLFQGLGGSGGIVLSRSIAADCTSGRRLAKMMAIIGAVNGVAPVLAPVVGGMVASSIGWRGIFMLLLGIGIVLLILSFVYRETRPKHLCETYTPKEMLTGYACIVKVKAFVIPTLVFAASNGVLFGYISSAPFIVQTIFGFSELGFAIVFGINAVAIGVGAALALKFKKLINATLTGACILFSLSLLQLVQALLYPNFLIYEILMLIIAFGLGLIFSTTTTFAMDAGRRYIGAASAIIGAVGFFMGGVISPIVGIGNALITSSIVFVGCSGICLGLALLLSNKVKGEAWI